MKRVMGWVAAGLVGVGMGWGAAAGQTPADGDAPAGKVEIRVDYAKREGAFGGFWAYFGYDECNYTTAPNGKKLLGELSALSPVPVYVRCHNLLTSGDGKHAIKWGSTNAYTEDADGKPVYDWTIMDRIFDVYKEMKVRPMVEIGFMPEALSVKPVPYRHNWPADMKGGWAYPPKDYKKWADLVEAWVRHSVERYGKEAVEGWWWELWNEPDIFYWKGTWEEFYTLYDWTADAVKRALPTAKVGGPEVTSPGHEAPGKMLRGFLEHCARGKNAATGKTGAPLDFVTFHSKGYTEMAGGRARMSVGAQLFHIRKGFEIVRGFPEFKDLPIIIGESDPEGLAAVPLEKAPQNAYRNGAQFAAYTAAQLKGTADLARASGANLAGAVTWAFEFEDMPWFAGRRELATNGVGKPVLNTFRMLGMMGGERLATTARPGMSTEEIIEKGVRGKPVVDAWATGRPGEAAVLVWHYHDVTAEGGESREVEVVVENLPAEAREVEVRHYRIDETHSNAFTAWKKMGSPQKPTAEEVAKLEAAGGLEEFAKPEMRGVVGRKVGVSMELPRQGVSLVKLKWKG